MTSPAAPPRALLGALAAAATLLGLAAPGAEAADPITATLDRTGTPTGPPPAAMQRAQDRLRSRLGARALVQRDETAGTPRIVARLDGFLTSPSARDPAEVALDYVREHATAFGLDRGDLATLRLTSRRRQPGGTVHLVWQQRAAGLPNIDGGLQAAVDGEGRLINVRGGALPDPEAAATTPLISAREALEAAVPGSGSAPPTGAPRGTERRTPFAGGGEASLVLYRDGEADRLGWRVLYRASSQAFYDAIVDARTGQLQRRVNRVHFAARINHFDVNPRAPGDSATLSDVPPDWLADERRLIGPYAHAVSDLPDTIWLDQDAGGAHLNEAPGPEDEVAPTSPPEQADREWDHPVFLGNPFFCLECSWGDTDTTSNRQFSTGQLFWYVNTFRDHVGAPPVGFSGAGEFKDDDAVIAQALDGAQTVPDVAHTSNANMTVLPDGFPGLMQMYLFRSTNTGRYDGAMDASVVYHEYAHGLSERLVTDSEGYGTLSGPQPGALSEGISDFYAMDFLADPDAGGISDTAAQGEIRVGHWLQRDPEEKGVSAFRTEGLDCPVTAADADECPGTASTGAGGYVYGDLGRIVGAPDVHADGEIWGQTLWSLRTALMAAHDGEVDPAHPGEDVGLWRTRAYITEGLRLAPTYPSFLDMRNAIVQAAVTLHGEDDWSTIWDVFAERGMGWSASTDGATDLTPVGAIDIPPAPGAGGRGAVSGTIRDEAGAPVAGVTVSVGGHDRVSKGGPGPTDVRAVSAANGAFLLSDLVAGPYADLYFRKPGFQELTTSVVVAAGQTTTPAIQPLRRDYASASSGATVSTTGPDYTAFGCGPAGAIDDDKSTVWSTDADGAKDLVVNLGRQLNLAQVRIDPRAGCGDPPEATLAAYELYASDGPGAPWERIAAGTIGEPDARGYVTLPLGGDRVGRRRLLLRALAPRSTEQGGVGPFMDVSELEVTGTPTAAPPPPPTPTPTPTPSPTPTAAPSVTPTKLESSKLRASRKGLFKVVLRFGSRAPAGKARLSVFARRKRIATGTLTVRPGRTVTKTLRLTSTGRRLIKPGRSRKVRLELRLPGGEKVKRTVRLTRKRR